MRLPSRAQGPQGSRPPKIRTGIPLRTARCLAHSHPVLSAITVTGIAGVCFSSSRIPGSTASTAGPFAARRYCGGRSEARARSTVFLEIPSCRATARADSPSDRCSRRISVQSPRGSPLFLLTPEPVKSE